MEAPCRLDSTNLYINPWLINSTYFTMEADLW
jgi:hypothetical protein